MVPTIEEFNEIAEFGRLIPICTHCKSIQNESEDWESVEDDFERHLDLKFSHGICPELAERVNTSPTGPEQQAR